MGIRILIEHHKEEYPEETREYFLVKFNRRWWMPWQYVQRNYSHSDPEDLRIYSLEEAVKVAKDLRVKYTGPKHTIRDLNEDGTDPNRYSGGW